MRTLKPETAIYTLFAVVAKDTQYLLLLCKKNVYKEEWGSSPSSIQWFTFVRPRDDIARRIEQTCSALYGGDVSMRTEGIISIEERVVTWQEPITEEQNNVHWEISRQADGKANNVVVEQDTEGDGDVIMGDPDGVRQAAQ